MNKKTIHEYVNEITEAIKAGNETKVKILYDELYKYDSMKYLKVTIMVAANFVPRPKKLK